MQNEILNCKNMIDSVEFMIDSYNNCESLEHLGFEETSTDPVIAKTIGSMKVDKFDGHTNVFTYKSTPKVQVNFGGFRCTLLLEALSIQLFADHKISNLISYDNYQKEWLIRIEEYSTKFAVKRTDLSRVQRYTVNLDDEAELFQMSLIYTEIPEYLFDIARDALKLINICPRINKILLKSEMPVIDLKIGNLKELSKE